MIPRRASIWAGRSPSSAGTVTAAEVQHGVLVPLGACNLVGGMHSGVVGDLGHVAEMRSMALGSLLAKATQLVIQALLLRAGFDRSAELALWHDFQGVPRW